VDVARPLFDFEVGRGDDQMAHRGGGDVEFEVGADSAADGVLGGILGDRP
jgi:hypothetical protein